MTLDKFVTKYNGKAVDVDKAYGPQCWDLAEAYAREVRGIKERPALPTGNGCACGCFTNFKKFPALTKHWTRQNAKNPITRVQRYPKQGWLVIWKCELAGSGGCGHIDICLSGRGHASGFVGFDQNWQGKFAHRVSHNYSGIVGYLIPK